MEAISPQAYGGSIPTKIEEEIELSNDSGIQL
jgi:hypothetical protein